MQGLMKTGISNFILCLIFFFNLASIASLAQNILQPQPYGGQRILKEFIREEMVYPEKELLDETGGRVVVSFVVNPDGSSEKFKVETPVTDGLNSEALRICRLVLWYPANDLGRPVSFVHSLEIRFDPKKYRNVVKSRGYDRIVYPYTPVDSGLRVYSTGEVTMTPKPLFTSKDCTLGNFISRNLQYPEAAFKQNISGMVRLKFVVEPSGRISNLLTEKTVGGGCTEEAVRVVKMIRWFPGIKNEVAVRTWRTLDITFDIANKSVSGTIPDPGQVH
ncbi:MAG: TonB family protein [Bacteroidetes bacterium]|nr:TonB family protein [Bacteroidota bacterium]